MPTERLSMRQSREIVRQKWLLGRAHRAIADSVGVSIGAVSLALARASAAGLTWEAVEGIDDAELERRLYPQVAAEKERPEPDCVWIHRERHRPNVTLELLHHEYLERHPNGLRYTTFCDRYRAWLGRRGLVMRQVHTAGDKAFVDYSGKKPRIVDASTGEVIEVELFVAALGASNLTYAEATHTQRGADWIASHVRALEYFGGVPRALVPDQLKSGVTRACLYEPEAQRIYEELAEHYGTTVLPARPAHPRDKAKVEVAVQIAQRWLLARIRDEVFHSLGELNARLGELLMDLNARVMRRYGKSRRDLFEQIERAALRPLPATRFEYATWLKARVNIDYHVAVEGHLYSVPYRLVHEQVEVRVAGDVVEVLHCRGRVAAHRRSHAKGGFTTQTEHMPSAHRAHAEWTPSRILAWAGKVGAATRELCEAILADRPHPEQGFRSCLGILRLGKRYGEVRLEAACNRALRVRARSYRHVESILKNGLDRVANADEQTGLSLTHENVRGRDYYH
ncbi:MAG TPA: IS21 family transposase [Solirubrobacteraceae bacterium]|nr:IS21 family transposase [Solirubrobacteraceae bacterium]